MIHPSSLERGLLDNAQEWRKAGLERARQPGGPTGIDFSSNDTLGLARDPRVVAAACEAAQTWGASGRAARLLGGGCPAHDAVEEAAADWLGEPRGLLFPSGFQANLGAVATLAGPGDVVLSDALNHASLIDAMRLSRARVLVYPHGDAAAAERLLQSASGARRRLLVTESVFGMDGDLAPLAELAAACARHDAAMIVDEAHAIGLLGPQGQGGWAACFATQPAPENVLAARILTGGKALGSAGAVVVGPDGVVEHLRQRARSFVFTTAPPPSTAAALQRAIQIAQESEEPRRRCLEHARRIARELDLREPGCAVVPILIGTSEHAVEAAARIQEQGLDVRAVRPPTVADGSARLRVVTHAFNTDQDVERVIDLARQALRSPSRTVLPSGTPSASSSSASAASSAASSAGAQHPKPLFVAGTDTGVGKTVVSALLLRAALKMGTSAYLKPVQTGDEDDSAEVARLCGLDHQSSSESPVHGSPALHFQRPASPHEAAAAEGSQVNIEDLDRALARSQKMAAGGPLLVELAGGLLVPLTDDYTQLDWMAKQRVDCVLVARSGLGTLNHTLLSLEALQARHLKARALFLVGPPHISNRDTLQFRTGLPLFELPPLETLSPETLDAWLLQHDLREILNP